MYSTRLGTYSAIGTTYIDEANEVLSSFDRPSVRVTVPLDGGGSVELAISKLDGYHLPIIARQLYAAYLELRNTSPTTDEALRQRLIGQLISPEECAMAGFIIPKQASGSPNIGDISPGRAVEQAVASASPLAAAFQALFGQG